MMVIGKIFIERSSPRPSEDRAIYFGAAGHFATCRCVVGIIRQNRAGGVVYMTNPFYLTTKWKKKRAKILRRDQYQCQECKRYGKATQATTVHHIHPLTARPDLRLTSWNLLSLCNTCHDRMHDRNTDELTDRGKRWVDKTRTRTMDTPAL